MRITKKNRHLTVAMLIVLFGALVLSGCGKSDEYKERQSQANEAANRDTLEKVNIQEKLRRDEDGNSIGYVYVMSFGDFVGYYTIKGKISSNGSQLEPEDLVDCPYDGSAESCQTIDGPQDDGTYGAGDPGIFFFTTEGAMVVTSLDYLYADQPIASAINVPKLNPAG